MGVAVQGMNKIRSFLSCSYCGDTSVSQPDQVTNQHAAPTSKASMPADSRLVTQSAPSAAPSNVAKRLSPTQRGDSALSASPGTQQFVPDDSGTMQRSRSDSSSSSCQIVVQRPHPNRLEADSSAGLPTVSGQLLAQSIAAEPFPATGKPPTRKVTLQHLYLALHVNCV